MKACAIVGSVWPTCSVPGISFTGTRSNSLYTAVVVANDPIPSVSKNAVTKPMIVCSSVGRTRPPRTIVARYNTSTATRPPSSRVLASIDELVGVGFRDVDGGAADLVVHAGEQRADFGGAVGSHRAVRREHRHRRLQRFDVERLVLTAEGFRRLVGDLLWRVALHPLQRSSNGARQLRGGLVVGANPIAVGIQHRGGIRVGAE